MRKMGATSSVHENGEKVENISRNEVDSDSHQEENAYSLVHGNAVKSINECQNLFGLANDRTGLNPDIKTNHLGISTQYLAEENARLLLANERLAANVKCLTELLKKNEKFTADYDPDEIYGEPIEQKLCRLQKHLATERQEKWSAIELGERSRVDLVNCEKRLTESNKKINELTNELEASRAHKQDLENMTKKVNGKDETAKNRGVTCESGESNLNKFRADLKEKREARQRALSAISEEMNGLREELQKERMERRKLERELESHRENSPLDKVISDNNSLRNEIDILTENVERLQNVSSENIRLKFEAKHLNAEMDSLNLNLGELKFEYYEEKRKHERTIKRLKELEKSCEGTTQLKTEWKEEKEKIFEKYDQEKEEISKRTNALKEVIAVTRQMLTIRENQVQELKTQLKDIEESVRKAKILEDNGLRAEYEKQMENIKKLKELYEERVRLMESERQKLDESLKDKAKLIKDQESDIESLRNQIDLSKQETKMERQENENMNRELRLTVAKCKDLENELRLINSMFTQMLLGPFNTGNETDLDKLTELLQENHDLIAELTMKEESSEIASVLPKLLLDLITQVDGTNNRRDDDLAESCDTISEQSESLLAENQGAVLPILSYKNATLFKPSQVVEVEPVAEEAKQEQRDATIKMRETISPAVQEIASNLPKVWKVLMELLSHHSAPEEPIRGDEKQCYKNVDTPNGPISVISVSKTFIRLKDLIIEKKALQKELTRLKHLNSHLETRLDDQEKRLSQVQCELHKTWGIVGRMRAQHQQLHNHEKILRYELQEKRVMLTELKQELEYCRDKWEKARQKNDESETEWKKLRREFAARKNKGHPTSSLNDSGESGFSDEQNESGEDFDADRSSTQSPIDHKSLEESEVDANPSQFLPISNSVEELIKQSEKNLKETTENIEEIKLEECATISAATASKAAENSRGDEDREKSREARDLRLKRLEEQCKLLVRQVDITSHKSNYLSDRLEELHEQYGSSEESRRQNQQSPSRTPGNNNNLDSSPSEEGPSTSRSDQQQTNEQLENESDDDSH